MTLPTLTVELGRLTGWVLGESLLGTDTTLATYEYDDITDKVLSASIRRGRQHELDRIETGTAQVSLLNQDGAFNAANTSSVYYPNIRPMVPLRIRASIDDFPTVADLAMRYDFSDASTLFEDTARTNPAEADDVILGVTDKSANARHLASPGSDGPQRKTAIQNSLDVARFTANAGRLDTGTLTIAQPTTIFMVISMPATSDQQNVVGGVTSIGQVMWVQATSSLASLYAGTTLASAVTPDDGVWRIWVGQFNGASSKLYLNGGAAAASGNAGSGNMPEFRIGSSNDGLSDFIGDGGEFLVYSSALSVSDINLVGSYLGTKWGITWTTAT